MINKNLETKLNVWCNKVSTAYVNIFYIINDDSVVIKRHNGCGVPEILHSFNSSIDLEKFLNKSEKLSTELRKLHDKFERENGLDLGGKC